MGKRGDEFVRVGLRAVDFLQLAVVEPKSAATPTHIERDGSGEQAEQAAFAGGTAHGEN
jgi:hypothetical protein